MPSKKPPYKRSVFINCPFDPGHGVFFETYVFMLCYLGLYPHFSGMKPDGDSRLWELRKLIARCKFSIHDISKNKSDEADERARLNMPFELGLDYGFRYWSNPRKKKVVMIFSNNRHDYDQAISDLSGIDIHYHHMDYRRIFTPLFDNICAHTGADSTGHVFSDMEDAHTAWRDEYPELMKPRKLEEVSKGSYCTTLQRWIITNIDSGKIQNHYTEGYITRFRKGGRR